MPVRNQLRKYQDLAEARPDTYIRFTCPEFLDASRVAMSKLLNVPVEECVFISNATTGVNLVLRNLVYAPGDLIIYFDTIYGACEKTIAHIMETTPVQARKVEYEFPCKHEEIVARFLEIVKKAKREGKRVRVAVFDTIVSLPGVRFPFERLVEACKREGVLSCIDAAHGVGQIPLDLGKLGADFLVSNCHKWLFTPRGCAIFHVPVRNQHLLRTTYPTSHGFQPLPTPGSQAIRNPLPPDGKSAFVSLFQFVATTDNSPYYCVPAALAFRENVCGGEEKITRYCESIVREGGDRIAAILGTDVMADAYGDLRRCAFANVRLPLTIGTGESEVRAEDAGAVEKWIEAKMVTEFETFSCVMFYKGRFWCRFSGQIYLEVEDYEWGGRMLKGLCERVRAGEHLLAGEKAKL